MVELRNMPRTSILFACRAVQNKKQALQVCSNGGVIWGVDFMDIASQEFKESAKQLLSLLKMREKWMTAKDVSQKFTDEELQMHLQSGRVIWRDDPLTWGCYEYLDKGDCEKVVNGAQTKTIRMLWV